MSEPPHSSCQLSASGPVVAEVCLPADAQRKPLIDKCRVCDHFGPVAPSVESACISHFPLPSTLVLLFLLVKHDPSSATLQLYFWLVFMVDLFGGCLSLVMGTHLESGWCLPTLS